MQQIEAIVRMSEQGVTHPFRCCAVGGEWWCKGWHTGIRSLVREWVCANLARSLGLPIPDFAILEVPLEVFETWARFQDKPQRLVLREQPFVFASKHVPHCVDVEGMDELRVRRRMLLERIFLFDHAIRNLDRSAGNSNLLRTCGETGEELHLIDHNNAFDAKFSEERFAKVHIARSLIDMTAEKAEAFGCELRHWVEGSLEKCWGEMPEEWQGYENLDLGIEKVREVLCAQDVAWWKVI